MSDAPRQSRRAEWLLALGALAGLGLAAASIFERAPGSPAPLPEGAVAVVNGVEIRREDLGAALDLLERRRGGAVSQEDRRELLDRLIDEELMIQQARALGIDRQDHVLRAGLIAALQESIIAGALPGETTAEEVARFYETGAEDFARVTRVRVRQMWFPEGPDRPADATREVAAAAAGRVRRGEPLEAVAGELGANPPAAIPDRLVDLAELRRIVGATAAAWAFELAEGEPSEPIHRDGGYLVLLVAERGAPEVPPLEAIETAVRAEMARRHREQAVGDYVGDLRRSAEIRIAQP